MFDKNKTKRLEYQEVGPALKAAGKSMVRKSHGKCVDGVRCTH